jgi:hypothetical protein
MQAAFGERLTLGLQISSLQVIIGDSLWCSSQPTLLDETYSNVTMSAFYAGGIIYSDLMLVLEREQLCKYDTEGRIKKNLSLSIKQAAIAFRGNYFSGDTPLFESYPIRMIAQGVPAFVYQPQWTDGRPDGPKKRFDGGELCLTS